MVFICRVGRFLTGGSGGLVDVVERFMWIWPIFIRTKKGHLPGSSLPGTQDPGSRGFLGWPTLLGGLHGCLLH